MKLAAINDLLAHITRPESPEAMASIHQIEANRRNALKSTGPKSNEGKAAVALNALKHGLYSSTLLLPEDDPAEYENLCRLHVDHYQPEGLEELDLVQQIVASKWELTRVNLMKQGACAAARRWLKRSETPGNEIHPTATEILIEVGRDPDCSKSIARVSQIEGRLERRAERARRELKKLQAERAAQTQPPDPQPQPQPEPKPPAPQPEPQAQPQPEPQPKPEAHAPIPATPISAAKPKPGPNGA